MKKLLRYLLVVSMLLCMSLSSISALGSISKPGNVISWEIEGEDSEQYEFIFDERNIEDIERLEFDLRTLMGKVNRGEVAIKAYLEQVGLKGSFPKNTDSIILIQEIRDLVCRNKETKEVVEDIEKITVTWEVPTLAEGTGEVYIFHYSEERGVYELIKPKRVDYANKTVTVYLRDLSPLGVVTIKTAKKPVDTSAVGTGVLGIVALGVGAFYILSKKED